MKTSRKNLKISSSKTSKLVGSICLTFLLVSLSACALLPAIDIGKDPFGITGQTISSTINSNAATVLTTQVKTATGSFTKTFNNVDKGVAPTPASLNANVTIDQTVMVSASDGSYPDTLAIELSFNGTLSDGGAPYSASGKIDGITLTKDTSCTSGSTSCSYTASGEISTAELDYPAAAMNIIFSGPDTNTVTVELSLQVTGSPADLANGSTITVTLEGQSASVKL